MTTYIEITTDRQTDPQTDRQRKRRTEKQTSSEWKGESSLFSAYSVADTDELAHVDNLS